MTDARTFGVVLIALFAWFFFIAVSDLLQLFESRRFGDAPLLLFCAVVCAGWIGFLVPLCWPTISSRSRLFHSRSGGRRTVGAQHETITGRA
jgi:hypothetical protein